jgi:hypothetical protein
MGDTDNLDGVPDYPVQQDEGIGTQRQRPNIAPYDPAQSRIIEQPCNGLIETPFETRDGPRFSESKSVARCHRLDLSAPGVFDPQECERKSRAFVQGWS